MGAHNFRPFRRDPAHPYSGPQTEIWAAGDQAECLFDGPWRNPQGAISSGPQKGEVRIVQKVCELGCHLEFGRWPQRFYEAHDFRKVTPRADALERAEPAFLELIAPKRVLAETLAIVAMFGTGFAALWTITP